MQIEDLRGQEFIHFKDDSIIYIVGRGRDGSTSRGMRYEVEGEV